MQDTPRTSRENIFTSLLNFIADPVVVIDEKGRFLLVNMAFEGLTGLKKEKVIGKSFLDLNNLNGVNKLILLENLRKRNLGTAVEPYEITFSDTNGETKHAEVKAKQVEYAGQPAELVVFRDITRRKKNEQRLKEYSEKLQELVEKKAMEIKESEEKFRAISTSAMDAIVLLDETDKIVYWNPAAERIFGYTTEEAVGKELAKLVVLPASRGHHLMLLEKRVEIKALRKDRTEFPIELFATTLKLKDRNCLLEIIRDVSERRKMEDDLRRERDKLEAVTENIGAGLTIVSKDYRILWANKFLRQIFGNVEQKTCYSTFHNMDKFWPNCGAKKVFDGATTDTHEFIFKDDRGNTQWIELTATPIKDKDGTVVAASELAVAITERKLMQNKLAEYSQSLEKLIEERTEELKQTQAKLVKSERLATIGELAAMVGHDLRNPLTGIKGATYYLKTKYGVEIDAKGNEMLRIIDLCIDYSNKIIDDLLEYSREMTLDLTETNPKRLLRHSMSMLKIPRNIQVTNAVEAEPKIIADKAKLNRVFVNIIKNAFDAMPNGGTLTITSKAAEDNVVIAFTDTGLGMLEETLSKLGSPLFTTKAKGMGFGLSICKRIVEAHDGKISVESTIGKGTAVTVTIPVNPKAPTENEEASVFNEPEVSVMMPQKVETENS